MCAHCATAFKELKAQFGERRGEYLLWEQTCYPMDGEIALRQARELIRRWNAGDKHIFDEDYEGPL